ncbi:MAG: DoxX-like family protein [Formosimonas sp.]
MMKLQLKVLRMSLVAVWLITALVSIMEWHGQSTGLLTEAGLRNLTWINGLIGAGVALDVVLGLLLWLRPKRWVYAAALASTLLMSTVATALLPSLWLHPLGVLSKNIPIVVILWVLWLNEEDTCCTTTC